MCYIQDGAFSLLLTSSLLSTSNYGMILFYGNHAPIPVPPNTRHTAHPNTAAGVHLLRLEWGDSSALAVLHSNKQRTVMAVDSKSIHSIEIANRPPRAWAQTVHAMIYFIVFNLGCLMINASQFVFLLPLRFLPLRSAKSLYGTGIRLSKGAFGALLSKSFRPPLAYR